MKRMKLLFTLALPVLLCQNAQAQTSSRLTAAAHWKIDGIVFKQADSTRFAYGSDARGGDLTHRTTADSTTKFDNETFWLYLNDSAYVNSDYYTQEFDINNNITSYTHQYWDGTMWRLTIRNLYTYNSRNNVTSKINQLWTGMEWEPQTKNVYTYDANNMVQIDAYMMWDVLTKSFLPYSSKTYTYDAVSKKVINVTDQRLFPSTSTSVYTEQSIYTYTSANQLLTTTHSLWNTGLAMWIDDVRYTNAYDTSKNKISMLTQSYNTTTSAWENDTYELYSNFLANHKPQTQVTQTWQTPPTGGAWANLWKYTLAYNSNDQLVSSTQQSWNVVGVYEYKNNDNYFRYYYETLRTAAVTDISNTNGTADMYPVPASNMLHIELKWNNAQASTIAIYDMTGKMVTPLINVPSATEYHTALPVSTLAAGMYVVKINGAEGQIVKQIVVAN